MIFFRNTFLLLKKVPPRSEDKILLLFVWCKISRPTLSSRSILLSIRTSVRTVVVRDPCSFMRKRTLRLAVKHTDSTLLKLRRRMSVVLKSVSAHLDSAKENSEDLCILKVRCAIYPILTQEVVTRDNKEYPTWCNWNQEAPMSFSRVWNGWHVWCHQSRQLQRNGNWSCCEKMSQFDFCHWQSLTVRRRTRLKLVHPSRLIQRKSLVSWEKKIEYYT